MEQLPVGTRRPRRLPETTGRRQLGAERDRRYERLEATILLYRVALVVCLIVMVMLTVALVGRYRHVGRAILVDGKLVCLTDNKAAAEQVRAALLETAPGLAPGATFRERWTEEDRPVGRDQALTVQEAVTRLKPLVTVLVPGTSISVEGRPLVVLSDHDTAAKTLEALKARFLSAEAKLLEPQRLANRVELLDTQVPVSYVFNDVSQAVDRLLKGTTETYSYAIKAGDSVDRIATQFGVTREALVAANPVLGRVLPAPGKTLQIKVVVPPVRVVTVKEAVADKAYDVPPVTAPTTTLPPGEKRTVTPGQPGRKRFHLKQTWENDKLVRSVVISSSIVQVAVPAKIMVGQKLGPSLTPAAR